MLWLEMGTKRGLRVQLTRDPAGHVQACVTVTKTTVENNVNYSVAPFSRITPLIPVAAH